nr:MAG TPA: hypothetical protein [Caudoviricetes sp.]
MFSNCLAICDIYSAKPAFYHNDDDYHLNRIGRFIAKDFDITIGSLYGSQNGTITVPQNTEIIFPIKIGDIMNVTLVNYGHTSRSVSYHFPELLAGRHTVKALSESWNKLMQAYTISSIDGGRIVLSDYNKFNHSLVTVGYAGSVSQMPLADLVERVTKRDMRAYACRQYPYTIGDETFLMPFRLSNEINANDLVTSFNDDFKTTNVKPYDILLKAIKGCGLYTRSKTPVWGSVVITDEQGPYVLSYIISPDLGWSDITRINPSTNVQFTNVKNASAATVWIQNGKNGDDYVRAGVIVAKQFSDGSTKFTTLNNVSEADYKGFGMSEIPSILIGYEQLLNVEKLFPKKEKIGMKRPNKTTFNGDKEAYEESKSAYKERVGNVHGTNDEREKAIEAVNKAVKDALGDPINHWSVSEILADALAIDNATIEHHDPVEFNGESYDWYGNILKNVREHVTSGMTGQYTPVFVDFDNNDKLVNRDAFEIGHQVVLYITNSFGVSIRGEYATISEVHYTPSGIKYRAMVTS